jgi:LysR family hydrogen peroxide-inducible transcriptional activator
MPLILQENFTVRLLELLRQGEIDCAIMALPLPDSGLSVLPLYDEDFVVAIPAKHPWSTRKTISAEDLKQQNMLLLGSGHCFRDQVLEVCPELSRFAAASEGIQRTFEGSSLETIRHMVAAGIGITVMPASSVSSVDRSSKLLKYIKFDKPVPNRRVVLAWRKSFPRTVAIDALVQAVVHCGLDDVHMIESSTTKSVAHRA